MLKPFFSPDQNFSHTGTSKPLGSPVTDWPWCHKLFDVKKLLKPVPVDLGFRRTISICKDVYNYFDYYGQMFLKLNKCMEIILFLPFNWLLALIWYIISSRVCQNYSAFCTFAKHRKLENKPQWIILKIYLQKAHLLQFWTLPLIAESFCG